MSDRSRRRRIHWVPVVAAAVCWAVWPAPAAGQSAENVAVVVNDNSAESQRIAEHYVRARGIPAANVIRIKTVTEETTARAAYASEIEAPIAAAIRRGNLQDRVLYIVLTKGVPLRVAGTEGQDGTQSSVDSELTLLYRRMTGRDVPVRGRVPNPYYLGTEPIRSAQPFTHRTHDIYLVTRLDGFTVEEVVALIDRGRAPSSDGRFVLDQRAGVFANPIGDRWLAEAHQRLTDLGFGDRVLLESTGNPARGVDNVLGYYSWGSNDPANQVRRVNMGFAPGALAATFVSTDARTMRSPPQEWQPSADWTNREAFFAGSPQSLVGDLIREGATGVAGNVAEPYLQSAIRPEVVFPAYASGFNLAEAFYLAMPDLSWQTIIIGDPLCGPFARKVMTRSDIEAAGNAATELPGLFAERRSAAARAAFKGTTHTAVDLYLRAEARLARGDKPSAREALGQAIVESPDFAAAHLHLATLDEEDKNYVAAADRYRHVVTVQPHNAIALNNLAFNLGVHQQKVAEALPFARKAFLLASGSPLVIDTLAWLEHLGGDTATAVSLFRVAVQRPGTPADVHLRAAIVFAAAGDMSAAEQQLSLALKIEPALEQTDDVRRLRELLKASSKGGFNDGRLSAALSRPTSTHDFLALHGEMWDDNGLLMAPGLDG